MDSPSVGAQVPEHSVEGVCPTDLAPDISATKPTML